jgi:hypothetical protein
MGLKVQPKCNYKHKNYYTEQNRTELDLLQLKAKQAQVHRRERDWVVRGKTVVVIRVKLRVESACREQVTKTWWS